MQFFLWFFTEPLSYTKNLFKRHAARFENPIIINIFAVHTLPEWRNGRRDGLKIHCPLKACGFESRLGHEQGKNRLYFFERSKDADGFSFSCVLPALLAPAGRYYADPPQPLPRGGALVGLRPPESPSASDGVSLADTGSKKLLYGTTVLIGYQSLAYLFPGLVCPLR